MDRTQYVSVGGECLEDVVMTSGVPSPHPTPPQKVIIFKKIGGSGGFTNDLRWISWGDDIILYFCAEFQPPFNFLLILSMYYINYNPYK